MKHWPMVWWIRRDHDFPGSLYRETCPICGAPALHWCRRKNGLRRVDPHVARRGAFAPDRGRTGRHDGPHEAKP